MKLKNSFVSMILVVSSAILPSVTTSPVPGHHLSFIQEAVSAFTAKAEKEFGSGKYPPYRPFLSFLLA